MTRKIPGFSNLSDEFASFLSEDHAAVSALFKTTNIAVGGQIPATRILFVYTHFAANGALEGAPAVGVRQVAQPSGSRILVVASLTPEDTIRNVMSFPGPNLVFTLDRKGLRLPPFSLPSLKACATPRTCFRRGPSLRRRRRWKRTTILSCTAARGWRNRLRLAADRREASRASVLQNF
jgi:hypothetical protein